MLAQIPTEPLWSNVSGLIKAGCNDNYIVVGDLGWLPDVHQAALSLSFLS